MRLSEACRPVDRVSSVSPRRFASEFAEEHIVAALVTDQVPCKTVNFVIGVILVISIGVVDDRRTDTQGRLKRRRG